MHNVYSNVCIVSVVCIVSNVYIVRVRTERGVDDVRIEIRGKEKRFVGRTGHFLSARLFVCLRYDYTAWRRVVAVERTEGRTARYLRTLLDEFSEVVKRRNVHRPFYE